MGDPAGVGPEIIVKAWAARQALDLPAFVSVGDPEAFARAAHRLGVRLPVREGAGGPDEVFKVAPVPLARAETPGLPDPANAPAVIAAISEGVRLTLAGEASALVTCPIAKATLYAAGFPHPGHTEFVAALTAEAPFEGPRGPVMMLSGPTLRVALASIHVSLRQALDGLTTERIVAVAQVVDAALRRDYGVARPRIALAGLNPHAGEGGSLGREEIEIVNPAAAQARALGLDITDAQPPDSLFHAEARARADAVLCLYHDQGLIPLKTLHFWDAVNTTLGLAIVRTSPDHGVAFDIAGKGVARADSLIAALREAAAIAARRARG